MSPNDEEDIEAPGRFVNLQAFHANLLELGFWFPDPRPAAETLRYVFEAEYYYTSPEARCGWILGAAQWIIVYGQGLCNMIIPRGLNTVPGPADDPDASTACPITLDDWQTWKNGFLAAGEDQRLRADCRLMAKHAGLMMDALASTELFDTAIAITEIGPCVQS